MLFLIIFKKANFFYREYISFKQKAFHNFRSTIPRKNHKTGILFTISYIKNVVANEINTINKNCPATPIGNLEDITLRAIKTLEQVDIIAAEDTRHTLKLLNHLNINKPMISYHRHNEEIKTDELINRLVEGKNIALVSDAGTPVISDPGEEVVKKCLENNIKVVPIPGACAAITALIVSGIDAKEFTFLGFLPLNKKNRKEKLEQIKIGENTIILYEAPHKLIQTLEELRTITGNRRIVLAKELTKIHESYIIGTAEELKNEVQQPKGEYVIVIEKNEKTIFSGLKS